MKRENWQNLLAVSFWVTQTACSPSEMCGNRVLDEIFAPDAKFKAVVFVRDCGATTDFSTQVSVLDAESPLANKGGNAFVADSNHGTVPFDTTSRALPVQVRWITAHHLEIQYDKRVRTFLTSEKVAGVFIEYKPF